MSQRLGISGSIARAFLTSEITPLLALVGFLLGVFAVMITPREEEPQINVTFANVFIAFPGASAKEVEEPIVRIAQMGRAAGIQQVAWRDVIAGTQLASGVYFVQLDGLTSPIKPLRVVWTP